MNKKPKETILDKKAERIWEDINQLHNSYTSDSTVSKFFLPEQLTSQCRPVAAAFATSLYTPNTTIKNIYASNAYYAFLLSIVSGVQIFLRERSLTTNAKPYSLRIEKDKVEKIKEETLINVQNKIRLSTVAEQVMRKFLNRFLSPEHLHKLYKENKKLDINRYDMLVATSIIWGYLFAKKLVR